MQRTMLITVVAVLLSLSSHVFAAPSHDIKGKKAGDIIAPLTDDQIAAWCDFNKQIIITNTNVLCVYNGAT